MYNTLKIEQKSLENILKHTTEYDIFRYYLGKNFEIGKVIKSPLRKDTNPSFGIFRSNKDNVLLFKDFGTGETGDCVKLVSLLLNINYKQALEDIYNNVVLNNNIPITEIGEKVSKSPKDSYTTILIKERKFNKYDEEYWSQYGITEEDLKNGLICPISKFWINEKVFEFSNKPPNIGYAIRIFDRYKIYMPLSSNNRFLTNANSYYIYGYELLPEGIENLIITKSAKDCLVLKKYGIYSISTQSETQDIPEVIINTLKSRFKNIAILYDNDTTGINNASKISAKYGFKKIFIDDYWKCKDISDFRKMWGYNITMYYAEKIKAKAFY